MHAHILRIWLLASGLLLAGNMASVAQSANPITVKLSTGEISLSPIGQFGPNIADSVWYSSNLYYLVASVGQTHLLPTPASLGKGLVQAAEKIAPGVYILGFSYKPATTDLQQLAISHITALSKIPKTTYLSIASFPPYSVQGGRADAWLFLPPQSATEKIREALQDAGIASSAYEYGNQEILQARLSQQQLEKVLKMPAITYLEPAPAPDKALNENSRAQAGYFAANSNALGSPMLTGKGVVVGIGDDSDPTLHPDFTQRVINHTAGIVNNHGAHVTGTTAGAGILQPARAGYAPEATIVSQFFSGVWLNAGTYRNDYGMVLTNNSYGTIAGECDKNGMYTLQSRLLDLQAAQYPSLLHVFASGNDGDFTCAPFPQHYSTVLQGYQVSKNIITVGRTDYSQLSSASSSSGPVRDGRLKPEITALGEAITSTRGQYSGPGSAYYQEWGTSMSAPAITGGLAQLYERYRQMNSGANPEGTLMKALLLNGARDLGTPGPDFRHGFGSMHLGNSLRMLNQQSWQAGNLTNGQVFEKTISGMGGAAALRVMVYWHDPAANPLAVKTLINDVDLEVLTPGGQTILPLILNSNPAGVTNAAAPGTDRVNNVEQVVISNPVAGNYTIRVRGFDITGSQNFALVWDTLPAGLQVSNPVQNQVWTSGSALPITWNDFETTPGTYTVAFSPDGGTSWTNIASDLPATTRFFEYVPAANLTTINALVRVTKNGNAVISGAFSLINAPTASAPAAEQCPGYIKMNWTAVAGAESYTLLMQKAGKMEPVATVNNATQSWLYAGLHPDSTYYVAVQPVIGGRQGRYRQALEIRPNTGACTLPVYDNDLALDSIIAPIGGRSFTSTQLSANETLRVRIRNRDNAAIAQFAIQYRINGGSLVQQNNLQPIAAAGEYVHEFTGINFASPGDYVVEAIVKNLSAADPNPANDTFTIVVRHLTNEPIALNSPLLLNFDELPDRLVQRSTLGVAGSQRWDYTAFDKYSRLRTLVTTGIARSGNRAITLDVSKAAGYLTNATNHFTGTFNLSNYTNASDIRLDFWWQQHGVAQQVHPQNKIWARGSDADTWIEIFDLGVNQPPLPGRYQITPSIPLARKLQQAGQQLSASTQIRIGQYALYGMADATHFAGYTIDDMQLLIAANDVQLAGIDSSLLIACGLGNNLPVTAKLTNTAANTLTNIPIRFRVNNGGWVNETVPQIAAQQTVDFTFQNPAILNGNGSYAITVEVLAPGDNVVQNNALSLQLVNQPVISQYPYLEDFEQGTGSWFALGLNNSWEWGSPASSTINTAASGQKAWKTALAGHYNDNEYSYLYSPCFNLQGMTNPTLSFAMAYDLEDCRQFNVFCDGAWLEYSTDGIGWQKLGNAANGTNWYDNNTDQAWTLRNQTHWHVATTPLPKINGNIRVRVVMASDDFTVREGVAIDDIHVYDLGLPVYSLPSNSDSVVQNIPLNQWVDFNSQNTVMASVKATNTQASQLGVKTWIHTGAVRSLNKAYYSQRNLTLQSNAANISTVNGDIRFYITDTEINTMRAATGCADCPPVKDYTQLNVQRYSGAGEEDGDLNNNKTGQYFAIPPQLTRRVPYANGYYYAFTANGFSEWWLTNATGTPPPLATAWLSFNATLDNGVPLLTWETANETTVLQYRIEASLLNNNTFSTIATVPGKNELLNAYNYIDARTGLRGRIFYRIARIESTGAVSYSAVKSVVIPNTGAGFVIAPVPAQNFITLIPQDMADGSYVARILAADGRTLWKGNMVISNGSASGRIGLSAIAGGWYTLQLTGADGLPYLQKFQILRP